MIFTLKAQNHQLTHQATPTCQRVMLLKSHSVSLTCEPEIKDWMVKEQWLWEILKPKEVTKRNGKPGLVKENCVTDDQTGHTIIQLQDDMIEKCKSSSSYYITDLSVKNYNGHTHLGSTSDTTIKEIDM